MSDKQKRVMRGLKNLATEQGHETWHAAYVVAARAEIDNRTSGPVLASLRKLGFVERQTQGPRVTLWRLSEQGRSLPLQ